MKKIAPIIFFAISLVFYACVSREQPDFIPVTPAISALNNNQSWTAALTDTLANDSLILHAQLKHDLLRIKLPASATAGNLTVSGKNGLFYIMDNNGNITNTFKLDATYSNTASITLNNGAPNKSISGTFNLRFVIDSLGLNTDTAGVNTFTFTRGQFVVPNK